MCDQRFAFDEFDDERGLVRLCELKIMERGQISGWRDREDCVGSAFESVGGYRGSLSAVPRATTLMGETAARSRRARGSGYPPIPRAPSSETNPWRAQSSARMNNIIWCW